MKFYLFLAAASALWAQTPPPPSSQAQTAVVPQGAPGADPVVLTVGDEKLTKSQFEQILSTLPPQQRAGTQTPEGRRKMAGQITDLLALAQAAKARGIDKTPKVALELQLRTDQTLASVLYQQMAESTKATDAMLHAYYDEHQKDWEEARARHILIRMQGSTVPLKKDQKDLTDAEALAKAKDLRAKILAGADFATLAKAESDDTGTGANGGDLGSFPHGRMVPAFDDAAFTLPIGEVSEPVKTQFGYHVIKVEERKTKPFEEVRAEIEQKIKPEIAKQGLEDVKKKTSITLDEAYFGK